MIMKTQLLTVPPAVVRAEPRKPPAALRPRFPRALNPAQDRGSWRYEPVLPLVKIPWIPLIISASAHALVMFGFNQPATAPVAASAGEDYTIALMEMPPVEELKDEPDEIFDGDKPEELDPGAFVPTQADIPSIVTDATFLQQMDYQSLLPKPDFDAAKVVSIPTHIGRGGVDPSKMKDLFNLNELDRVPTPLLQQPPVFPAQYKSEVSHAEVLVEFIVDKNGKVPWAKAVSSSHRGFEDAAVLGVSRWQFRPGMKNGQRVATRMQVPLRFRVVDGD